MLLKCSKYGERFGKQIEYFFEVWEMLQVVSQLRFQHCRLFGKVQITNILIMHRKEQDKETQVKIHR